MNRETMGPSFRPAGTVGSKETENVGKQQGGGDAIGLYRSLQGGDG